MTKEEKQSILDMPTIATCWEDYPNGVEIKDIEYGVEDKVLCVTQTMTDHPRCHRVKVVYDGDRSYIVVDGFRIYLDNCLKC